MERTREACMAMARLRRWWAVREPVPPSRSSAAYFLREHLYAATVSYRQPCVCLHACVRACVLLRARVSVFVRTDVVRCKYKGQSKRWSTSARARRPIMV